MHQDDLKVLLCGLCPVPSREYFHEEMLAHIKCRHPEVASKVWNGPTKAVITLLPTEQDA